MVSPSPNPYDVLAGELRELVHQEGASLWESRDRLLGLLLDQQPELRREIRSIMTAVDAGVPQALAATERQLAGIAIDRQANLIESEAALRADVARAVTRAIAHALDLGPLPSVYPSDLAGPTPAYPPPTPVVPPQYQSYPPMPDPSQWGAPPVPASTSSSLTPFALLGGAVAVAAAIIFVPGLVGGGGGGTPSAVNQGAGYGNELADYGVAAQATLQQNVGSPTPLTIPSGKRITTDELRALIERDRQILLVDVLANPHPATLNGAVYIPAAGMPGTFNDRYQEASRSALASATNGDRARPIVFFCAGTSCWESYNATLRAAALGYSSLYWYRGGLFSWQQANLPMQALPPALGTGA